MRPFFQLRPHPRPRRGFTLLEVLITLAILLVILVALMDFMNAVDEAWKTAATDPFAEAQDAFEAVVKNLASATLEPYQDYADVHGDFRTGPAFVPDHLARRSDLDFVCGPAGGAHGLLTTSGRTISGSAVFFITPTGYTQTLAHQGLDRLLNAMGYLVEFGDDSSAPSFILPQAHRWRWRLKQIRQPAESLQIFSSTTSSAWLQQVVPTGASLPVLAENVVALIVLPERAADDSGAALSPAFNYDSRDTGNLTTQYQLPARLTVVLVAIDPTSAARLAAQDGSVAPALVPGSFFQQATSLDADLASLDTALTTQAIGHCQFQREIVLSSAAWSNTSSP